MSFFSLSNPSVRSYTQSIPRDIVFLSESYKDVLEFEEKYAGIYNITSLLVSGRFEKTCLSLDEFRISGYFPELLITYTAKGCIDFEKCNYCGECYSVCPVNCIDLDLGIDFDKCIFCDRCKELCKQGAIDVNLAFTGSISTPFIVTNIKDVLDEYGEQAGVFNTKDMDKVFALTGDFQVSEIIEHGKDICQFNEKLKYGCERCLGECPHNALYVENGEIKVNHILCKACGKCVAVCPTGAMQSKLMLDKSLYELLSAESGSRIAVVGNKEDLRKFSWVNENHEDIFKIEADPSFFNTANYLSFFAKGYSNLYLLGREPMINNEIAFSNKLIDYLFKKKNFIKYLSDYKLPSGNSENPLKETMPGSEFSSRRGLLSNILKFLYRKGGVKDVLIEEPYLNIFGEVLVDETKCSLCLSCVQHCKIGALTANSSEYSLHHTPSSCIQCKICEEVCPEEAIRIRSGLLLSESFFETHLLHKSEPVVCPSCGKEFGVKVAHERVMNKLRQKGFGENRLSDLRYCDMCRIKVKLQEGNYG